MGCRDKKAVGSILAAQKHMSVFNMVFMQFCYAPHCILWSLEKS